jgi:hypothetical protein
MEDRDVKPCPVCGDDDCPDWGDCWSSLDNDDDSDDVCTNCWDPDCPGCE